MYYIIIFVLYLYWFFMLFLWIGGGQYTESNTQVSIDWLIRRLGKLATWESTHAPRKSLKVSINKMGMAKAVLPARPHASHSK